LDEKSRLELIAKMKKHMTNLVMIHCWPYNATSIVNVHSEHLFRIIITWSGIYSRWLCILGQVLMILV